MSEKQTPITASNFLYSVLPAVLLETNSNRAQGPDLSHWSGTYDPTKATRQADFVITKATEGYNWIDPELDEIWDGMMHIEIRGLYHYQRSGMSWSAQATHFLRTVDPLDHHIIALDVESINNTVNATFIQDSYRILNYLEQNSEAKVVLYTNPDLFQNYIYPIWVQYFGAAGRQKALTIPLWIAQYWNTRSPDKNPGMPSQRQSWDIYQWTDRGVGSEWGTQELGVDLNVFNGSIDSMRTWLGLSEPTPDPETDPISEPTPDPIEEPIPEEGLWKATVISTTRMMVRSYPEVRTDTKTGNYVYPRETIIGRLWSGNGYVWIRVTDLSSPIFGNWIAVRSLDGTSKFITLERVVTSVPSTGIPRWLVKHDIQLGSIWRPGLPEVHPLYVLPNDNKGNHFSPFQRWAQLLARIANPLMDPETVTKIYQYNYWIANGQGFGDQNDLRANYILNRDLEKPLPKVESLTCGGSLLEGIPVDDLWVKVNGLHYNNPISFDFLKQNPQFCTRGVYSSGTGVPYRMLGHKYSGEALIHPLIIDEQYGLYIQKSKLIPWTNTYAPDPLKIYL